MPLAIEESHIDLAAAVDDFIDRYEVQTSAREQLDRPTEVIPGFWKALATTGFLGVHLAEEFGGADAGLAELAIVVERFGYAMAAGPLLATATTSAIVADGASDSLKEALLFGLASGELVGATGLNGTFACQDGVIDGRADIVLGAHLADVLVLSCGDSVLIARSDVAGLTVEADPAVDP